MESLQRALDDANAELKRHKTALSRERSANKKKKKLTSERARILNSAIQRLERQITDIERVMQDRGDVREAYHRFLRPEESQFYHGTETRGLEPGVIDSSLGNLWNLKGVGLYTTESGGIARSGYARPGRWESGKEGITYKVKFKPGSKFINLENKPPAD